MIQKTRTALYAVLFFTCVLTASAAERPNIVWISLEDITPMMGCYGDKYARTPVFDKLASEGSRYTKAHSIAPVCSVSRSSIITGMYPQGNRIKTLRLALTNVTSSAFKSLQAALPKCEVTR